MGYVCSVCMYVCACVRAYERTCMRASVAMTQCLTNRFFEVHYDLHLSELTSVYITLCHRHVWCHSQNTVQL